MLLYRVGLHYQNGLGQLLPILLRLVRDLLESGEQVTLHID